ncbi:MAG: IS21 family transposase [Candidatus Binataceae bacterium]
MVKDAQVGVLRRKRMEGKTQEAAAATAGMSVRSARKWERGLCPSQRGKPRTWRTRGDPFAEVFEGEVVALLAADRDGVLEATTLLGELNRRHPGRFSKGQLRTLQRRVRQWRGLNGPEKEVYFPQEHPPGREAAYDFTNCDELGVTICGAPFAHLLFELVLSFSGWRWPTVALSESFEALAPGVEEALWRLGGVTEVLRSDNLSAATHELPLSGGRALTKRYQALLEHYRMKSTRIFPRKAHENGVVEQAHRRTKSILAQMLVLRASRDFASVGEYQRWVREVIEREHNALLDTKLAEERSHLRPLPSVALPAYTAIIAKVRRWSTIRVLNHTYSVPARLIGERVRVLLHHDHLEVYFAGKLVERLPRLRGQRWARIDYHHVIWSLAKKPGAFARYRWREEMFPSLVFRRAYDVLRGFHGERADLEYVRILHMAATSGEAVVERSLRELLESAARFAAEQVRRTVRPERPSVPAVTIGAPDLRAYDALLEEVRS